MKSTKPTGVTFHKLQDELLVHPIMTSMGSLALSMFISRSIYGVVDWRPVLICVSSDIITIGLDHFNDQSSSLALARKTSDTDVVSLFGRAQSLLTLSAIVLCVALSHSPPLTWLITAVFVTPALLWDTPLFARRVKAKKEEKKTNSPSIAKNGFIIKRVPGMKAVFIGIIRGCGTFAVVHSILSASLPKESGSVAYGLFTPTQIITWSTINRTCHAVMADVRDFHEDWALQVPTIPVLLKSVFKTQVLLTVIHLMTLFAFIQNIYIVFGCIYAIALVWLLNEDSPRGRYRLSFHSQTIVAVLYGVVEGTKGLLHYH